MDSAAISSRLSLYVKAKEQKQTRCVSLWTFRWLGHLSLLYRRLRVVCTMIRDSAVCHVVGFVVHIIKCNVAQEKEMKREGKKNGKTSFFGLQTFISIAGIDLRRCYNSWYIVAVYLDIESSLSHVYFERRIGCGKRGESIVLRLSISITLADWIRIYLHRTVK